MGRPTKFNAHRETAKHHAAFEAYYAAERDFTKAAENCTVTSRSLREWAVWFDWVARADYRDREAAAKADRDAIKRRSEMLKRHRQAAELLTRRGIEHFAKNEIERANDAISAIKTGVEMERTAEGMPAWVGELLNADEQQLRREYERLDARRRAAVDSVSEASGNVLAESDGNGETEI
jgi:hypothetical protein